MSATDHITIYKEFAMRQRYAVFCLTGVLALSLFLVSACAKKNIQATADAQEGKGQAAAKLEASLKAPQSAKSTEAPPEPPGSASKSAPLTGFEPTRKGAAPSEESVSSGIVVAKTEPAGQRMEEQAAKAAADTAGTDLEDIYFGFDSWKIVEKAKQALERDTAWLIANPDKKLTIEGHCDERGTLEYNLVLGEKRAKAVKQYLAELGVDTGRLQVTSFGKEKPFCQEHQESCYQKNRRGHLVVRAQ